MKSRYSYLIGFIFGAIGLLTAGAAEKRFDDAHRFVFYAVLEGCYEDGLSTNDVAQILMSKEGRPYFHFVYACPICLPTIHALEVYRSSPQRFYGYKAAGSTFGPGLELALATKLRSEKTQDRVQAINTLVQRWISRRMEMLRLTDTERETLQAALEKKREEGMGYLENARKAGNIDKSGSAFAEIQECAACNGAVGKPMR